MPENNNARLSSFQYTCINLLASNITSPITTSSVYWIERAKQTAIRKKRDFFDLRNFSKPFYALPQNLFIKQLTGPIYFFTQAQLKIFFTPHLEEKKFSQFFISSIK